MIAPHKYWRMYEGALPSAASRGAAIENVTFAPINLVSEQLEDVLLKTGYNCRSATLFLCEGLIRYLSKECVQRLFVSLRTLAAAGSKLILNSREYQLPIRLATRRFFLSLIGEPIQSVFAIGEINRLLGAAGWKISREVRRTGDRTERILIVAEPTQ